MPPSKLVCSQAPKGVKNSAKLNPFSFPPKPVSTSTSESTSTGPNQPRTTPSAWTNSPAEPETNDEHCEATPYHSVGSNDHEDDTNHAHLDDFQTTADGVQQRRWKNQTQGGTAWVEDYENDGEDDAEDEGTKVEMNDCGSEEEDPDDGLPATDMIDEDFESELAVIGPNKPKDFNSFLWLLVAELIQLSLGVTAYDTTSGSLFTLRAYLILVFGDMPAIAMVMQMKGHNGISPCRSCHIKGIRIPNARGTTHYVPLD
ncbi:hypothetical protein H0H81_003565 [Sphagnurus paluster]|uniref:Uncharacterized protein n=1 Tax=Sphagnurus paluster TaxID=117069 RepID=A0A9P7GM79_9AGAR|nr:hypothetical protein H0H81_003565 [Sphagnurus paluster]